MAVVGLAFVLAPACAPQPSSRSGKNTDAPTDALACPSVAPALASANTGRLSLPISITVGDQPLRLNQRVAGGSGREYHLTALQVFLAAPRLKDDQSHWVAAQLLDDAGRPRPYGVVLVDSEKDLLAPGFHLAAPPGTYTALALGIGLPAPCNATSAHRNVYPLNTDSGMWWGPPAQFLFFRVEGRALDQGSWTTLFHHMGFDEQYRTVVLPGTIAVGDGGPGPTLTFDLGTALDASPVRETAFGAPLMADQLAAPGVFSLQP